MVNSTLPTVITKLDLQMVKQLMVDRKSWTPEFFDTVERKYKGYLALCIEEGDWCPPSIQVDELWHNHILFTREYIQMCRDVFGFYLHHAPLSKSDVTQRDVTRQAMTERFGFDFDDKEAPCCTRCDGGDGSKCCCKGSTGDNFPL